MYIDGIGALVAAVDVCSGDEAGDIVLQGAEPDAYGYMYTLPAGYVYALPAG